MNTYHRPANARGRADFGWLNSRHSFSFGNYFDPEHMGFGPLRVINEDLVQPGAGFGAHGHRDMEIITYVIDGALAHKDSLGNGSEIRPGDVQRMTAGRGIRHSEFNASDQEPVKFLQIWVMPEAVGLEPGYEQRNFDAASFADGLILLVSPDGRDNSVAINQDAFVYGARAETAETLEHTVGPGRKIWIQIVAGDVTVNGNRLHAGDGLGAEVGPESGELVIEAAEDSHFLLFDMPEYETPERH